MEKSFTVLKEENYKKIFSLLVLLIFSFLSLGLILLTRYGIKYIILFYLIIVLLMVLVIILIVTVNIKSITL